LDTVWAALTKQKPDLLLEALVQAFWRGEFERDVSLVSTEDGDVHQGHTAITVETMPPSKSMNRSAGNYAVRHDGVIVKVGKDDVSRPADWSYVKVYRDAVARGADIPDWDSCTEPGAGNRLVAEEALRDFAGYGLDQWSQTTVERRFKYWRLARADFATWYAK